MVISLGLATQLNAAEIPDVIGTYDLFTQVKFKAKGLGKMAEEGEGDELTLGDGSFVLGPVTGDFELDAKGKKILFVSFDEDGLTELKEEFAKTISLLVDAKYDISIDWSLIDIELQPIKVSKIKIDKKTNEPTKKFKVAVKGIAGANVPFEGYQTAKFSFKGKFTILGKQE
jgi:hypothetical protein